MVLSAEAMEALEDSKNWSDYSPYCDSSERYGRGDYLEKVVLLGNPNASEILEELRPQILRWSNYAGD